MKVSNRPAYTLAIVLFIIIVLLAGSMFALYISKQRVANTSGLLDKFEAQMFAESELEILKFYGASGIFIENRIENDSLSHTYLNYPVRFFLDNRDQNISSTISIKLQDTAGLLSINTMEPDVLVPALNRLQKISSPEILTDSLSDWIDDDDFHLLNGAESNYYREQKKQYIPRNNMFIQSVDELRIIKGFSELPNDQWENYQQYLTFSPRPGFNYLTASPEIISAVMQIPLQSLEGIKELRQKDLYLFTGRMTQTSGFNVEDTSSFPSRVFYADIVCQRGNAMAHVHALISCFPTKTVPYSLISVY